MFEVFEPTSSIRQIARCVGDEIDEEQGSCWEICLSVGQEKRQEKEHSLPPKPAGNLILDHYRPTNTCHTYGDPLLSTSATLMWRSARTDYPRQGLRTDSG